MDYKNLKDAIKAVIKKNGAQEITGQIMQDTLLSIVSKLGGNKTFAGVARPTTVPDTTDANIFYIAGENGTYVNFGGAKVENEAAVFVQVSDGTWRAIYTGIQTSHGVNNQLQQEHEYFETAIGKVSADLTQFKQTEFTDVKEDVAGHATEIAKNKSDITKINGEIATLNEASNTAADELVRIEGKVDANLKDAVVVFGPSTNTGVYKGADILSFTNDTPTGTVTAYMSQYWDKLVKLASGKISGSVYAESNNANCTGGSCIGGTQFGYLKIEIEDYQKGGLGGEALVLSFEVGNKHVSLKIHKRNTDYTVERTENGKLWAENVVQSIGESETNVMSQKAVTEALGGIAALDAKEVLAYGIEFDTEISSPICTRIGNQSLHRKLPIQNRMRGCLLNDNGEVVKYLNPKTWEGETRDGSQGQVMVEIPKHYRLFETEGTKRRVWVSLVHINGFTEVPTMYVSAYEAALERSTGKLCSVVNMGVDFRGGNNTEEWDGTYRTLLGRPVTATSRTGFRTAARKRGSSSWNCYLYDVHKAIFWLFCVEYATLNSQDAYTAELTPEGYHKGGLGLGFSDLDNSTWKTFNGYNPFVPCGHTDSLGNQTGVVAYTANGESGSELKTSNVNRYRGIENPFGHIWKWSDGINVRISANTDKGGGGLSKVFVCSEPTKFSDTNYNGYKHVGNEARNEGFVKEVIFGEEGEIMPSLVGGGSTQYFSDYHYTNIPGSGEQLRGVLFGGDADYGSDAGLAFANSYNVPSNASANFGSRLCYIPANA